MRALSLSVLVALAVPLAATAQPMTGADVDALFQSEPQVEVNLQGSLLRLAAEAARAEEPEAALMLDGLRKITVRIYPTPPDQRGFAIDRLTDIGRQFESQGWFTLVRVRSLPDDPDNDEDVWVFVRDDGDSFDGMAVLAFEPEDQTSIFVLIDGTVDPTQVAELSRRFARVDIDGRDDDDDRTGDDDE